MDICFKAIIQSIHGAHEGLWATWPSKTVNEWFSVPLSDGLYYRTAVLSKFPNLNTEIACPPELECDGILVLLHDFQRK